MEQIKNRTSNDFLKSGLFEGISTILEKDSNLDIFSSRKRIQLESQINESDRKITTLIEMNLKASEQIKLLKKEYARKKKTNDLKLNELKEKI